MTDTQLKTSYLTITQLSTLTGRILEMVAAGPAAGTYPLLDKLTGSLRGEHKALAAALNLSPESAYTAQLKEYDDIRDDAFIALRDYIDSAARRRKKPILRAAAEQIRALFEKHGNRLYSLGYADQTGKMHQLLVDLETAAMQSALDRAGARELYEEMVEAQQRFEELLRSKLEAERPEKKQRVGDVVPVLKFQLLLLIRCILFLGETGDVVATETGRRIHEAVEDIMTIAKARKTRADGEEEAADQGPVESA